MLIFLLHVTVSYAEKTPVDPTQPTSMPVTDILNAEKNDAFQLEAIITSGKQFFAIINGEKISKNQQIQGYIVNNINTVSVELRSLDKTDRITLWLDPLHIKQLSVKTGKN